MITCAELCRDTGRIAQGESHYRQAIQVGKTQLARAFELRATPGLAQMEVAAGRGDDAVELLHALCAGFPDAASSVDWAAARDLLQRHRA